MSIRKLFYRWRRYQQIVRELDAYSHRELTELGIAAADISRVAASAAAGEYPTASDGEQTVVGQHFSNPFDASAPQPNG
jgi:uncharacterized protein YjiS (DUF1127 family)